MKTVSLLVMLFLLSGCSMFSSKQKIEEYSVDLDIQESETLNLNPVQFIVVTKENATDIISKEQVLFSLTGTNYKALSDNIEQIKEHLKLQKKIILEYKKFYTSVKESEK